MIDGVIITPLRQFVDERGKVMLMLRASDQHFQQFGEIYFSCIYPGAIKAWHMHLRTTLNYAVPLGHVKLALYDDRPSSPTNGEVQEMFLGPDSYNLVTVPPMVWNGFKGYGTEMALLANCASIPHDPSQISRRDPFDRSIPYDWSIRHG